MTTEREMIIETTIDEDATVTTITTAETVAEASAQTPTTREIRAVLTTGIRTQKGERTTKELLTTETGPGPEAEKFD